MIAPSKIELAVCPACDNPIQIVSLYRINENSPRPYGKHTCERIEGFPNFHPENYKNYRHHNKKVNFASVRKQAKTSAIALQTLQIIRDKFDLVIEDVEEFSGFSISPNLASRMLKVFMSGEGYLYIDLHLQNIPWIFAYRTANHELYGQKITDTDLKKAILDKVDHAYIDENMRLSKNPAGGFNKVYFCFIHHRRSMVDDELQESMKLRFLKVSPEQEREVFLEKKIVFDQHKQNRLFGSTTNQSIRSQELRSRAKEIISERFPNLDQMIAIRMND